MKEKGPYFSGAVSDLLVMCGFERETRNINMVGLLAVIILCTSLIPPYGMLGAAIALSIGVVVKECSYSN